MKKLTLAVLLVLVFSLLIGCGSAGTNNAAPAGSEDAAVADQNVVDNRTPEEPAKEDAAKPAVSVSDEDFEVTGYLYADSWGNTSYFLVVKNNSKAAVSLSANGIAKDANGNMIGADDMSIDVLGPGEQSIGQFYFNDVTGIADVEYSLSYTTDGLYYDPVVGKLEVQQTINDGNVVVAATNNGDVPAEFVEAYALFFDAAGNVVGYDSAYLTDNDSEIKPGKTQVAQLDAYEAFDTVQVFLTGRHYNG